MYIRQINKKMSESAQQQNNEGFQEVRHNRNPRPNRKDVLDKVATGDIKPEDADKMLRTRLPPRFVVTRTGSIALYNLQRNPIVLYADQWDKLSSLLKRDILDNYMAKNTSIIKRRYQHPRNENVENVENVEDQ